MALAVIPKKTGSQNEFQGVIIMQKIFYILILLFFSVSVTLCGCAIHLTKKGELVRVTDDIADVEDCECKELIYIRSRIDTTNLDILSQLDENQINRLRNKSAKLGCNFVVVRWYFSKTNGVFYPMGEAYNCNGANDVKTASDD
jgi:hypothetical protein